MPDAWKHSWEPNDPSTSTASTEMKLLMKLMEAKFKSPAKGTSGSSLDLSSSEAKIISLLEKINSKTSSGASSGN